MKRFKNILVVYDGKADNRALHDQAVNLARRNQAVLTVVDVIEEARTVSAKPSPAQDSAKGLDMRIIEDFPFESSIAPASASPANEPGDMAGIPRKTSLEIQEFIIQEEKCSLGEFVSSLRHAGIQVHSKTLYGIPFIKVIQEVLRGNHDLVMVTAEGMGGLRGTLFGNTTMHLMRKCPCPVWVIKPGQPRKFERILAAVEVFQEDVERAALTTKILELATSLARFGDSELLIFHAWKMYGESIIKGQARFPTQVVEKLLQDTQEAHRQGLIELLQGHSLEDLKNTVYLLKGEAGDLIPELARAREVDLIVMGTVSRTGIAGLLIGNTAEIVLQQVDCSVLTVKPEGFVTPVKLEPA